MVKICLSDNSNSLLVKVFPEVAEQYAKTDTKGMSAFEKLAVINKITESLKLKESEVNADNTHLKPSKRLDSETNKLALEITEMLFEDGFVKFPDYSERMIIAIGKGIRPYLKGFYEYARAYYPELEMTDSVEVARFDLDKLNSIKM